MKLEQLTDEEVVELVLTDQEMYKELVKRYQDKLYRYAVYLIHDTDKAEDAVQNALIKGFVNMKGFKTNMKFSSWMYRITHNEAINIVKKDAKQTHWDTQQWKALSDEADIEETYTDKQMQKLVRESLERLPVEYRSPLVLYFMEDKTYQEISDIMRIPVNTVGTRIRRGKLMLIEIYTREVNDGR